MLRIVMMVLFPCFSILIASEEQQERALPPPPKPAQDLLTVIWLAIWETEYLIRCTFGLKPTVGFLLSSQCFFPVGALTAFLSQQILGSRMLQFSFQKMPPSQEVECVKSSTCKASSDHKQISLTGFLFQQNQPLKFNFLSAQKEIVLIRS